MRATLLLLTSLSLFVPIHAHAGIGEITETDGKVQIKTVKAERVEGAPGTEINMGDLVKVRK